jgi:hypothetical protein
MKHTILFLLIPLFAFAQKSEQVKAYLGESKYMDIPVSGKVNFVFQKGTLTRVSDGKKSFAELLPDGVGYSDADNAGKLKAITENGVLIRPYVPVKSAAVPESARPMNFDIPDSLSFLEQTEQLKEKATFWESQMWQVIKPLWSVVMHFFWILFPLCLVVMGALWFWAKLSASEEFSGLHYKTSKALTLAVGGTWTVFLINGFMTVVSMEMGFVGLVFCTALLCVIAFKSAAWIVPNFRQKMGGRPQPNFHNRQLPG